LEFRILKIEARTSLMDIEIGEKSKEIACIRSNLLSLTIQRKAFWYLYY
jgi:hypothetical protein